MNLHSQFADARPLDPVSLGVEFLVRFTVDGALDRGVGLLLIEHQRPLLQLGKTANFQNKTSFTAKNMIVSMKLHIMTIYTVSQKKYATTMLHLRQ